MLCDIRQHFRACWQINLPKHIRLEQTRNSNNNHIHNHQHYTNLFIQRPLIHHHGYKQKQNGAQQDETGIEDAVAVDMDPGSEVDEQCLQHPG